MILMIGLILNFFDLTIDNSWAQTKPYIQVGSAKTRRTILAFPEPKITNSGGSLTQGRKTVFETITNDLMFTDLFKFLDPKAFNEKVGTGIKPGEFKISDWTGIGVEFLIKTSLKEENKVFTLEGHLYEISSGNELLGKQLAGGAQDLTTLAHTFANEIVTTLTKLPGIFLTKIVMSCDRSGHKEIYLMDYDGTNVRQITRHRSTAIAPAWHPSGKKIVYSLFTKGKNNVKNIDLFEYDFTSSSIKLISAKKGINSGAAYSPDGKKIAATLSYLGNPEIFVMDENGKNETRITSSFGFDVDPAWSPDGKKISFVSSRSGMPMVYSMNQDGTNIERLTFAGRYNATPSWSSTNNKIAFAGWIDQRFDIFIMNPDGTTIERLTKNQGNNEDPHFSPDGQFVVFSSNRVGQKNIYAMNIDGTFVKRLTYGLGNCTTPKWSNTPKL